MEVLRLSKELEGLIEKQKTLMGLTMNFRQDEFLTMTNRIRAAVPSLLPEQIMLKTENVLRQYIQSPAEVSVIMNDIRTAALS